MRSLNIVDYLFNFIRHYSIDGKGIIKSFLLLALVTMFWVVNSGLAYSQEEHQPTVDYDQANQTLRLGWQSSENKTFFPQISSDLKNWKYLDTLHFGTGPHVREMPATAPKSFYRLRYSSFPVASKTEAEIADFDMDGLSNIEEVRDRHTDPLVADTDNDGLPDGWEVAHRISPLDNGTINVANGPAGVFGGASSSFSSSSMTTSTTTTNAFAFGAGVQADPAATLADLDGDGITNEQDAGARSKAIDWEATEGSAKFFHVPLRNYSDAIHGDVLGCNAQGDVITRFAVYSNGSWKLLAQLPTGPTNPLPITVQVHGIVTNVFANSQCYATSMADDGRIVGSVQVTAESNSYILTTLAIVWDSWAATPRLLTHAPGSVLIDGGYYDEYPQIASDGTIVNMRHSYPTSFTDYYNFDRFSIGGVETSPSFRLPFSIQYGRAGFLAFNLGFGPVCWLPGALPVTLFADSTFSTANTGYSYAPIYVGEKPGLGNGYSVNYWKKVMIRHKERWHEAEEMGDATHLTKKGVAFRARNGQAVEVWKKGASSQMLNETILNYNFTGLSTYIRGSTQDGSVLLDYSNDYGLQGGVGFIHPVEVSWVAINGSDHVEDHIDPWTKKTNGKRIFPEFKNPDDTELRHKLEVIVKTSPALSGRKVYVKSFDVDDSTSEDFDLDENGTTPVIDTNGKVGDDNLTDYLNTPKNGQFWTGSTWGGQTAQGTVDANGETKFIFRVGIQPGSNYRVVASLIDETMYADVQTSDPLAAKYLGPEASQDGGTAASPLLTVWRRLWIENDSMGEIGAYSGGNDKKNDLTSDMGSPTIQQVFASNDLTTFYIPSISDGTSFTTLQNGTLKFPGIGDSSTPSNTIQNMSSGVDAIQVAGNKGHIQVGSIFRLYDDDGFGLNSSPLPRNDLVDDRIKGVYRPAFIEVMDANLWNDHKTVDFYRSHPPVLGPLLIGGLLGSHSYGVLDDALDAKLEGNKNLWCASVIVAYQPGGEDSDPNDEESGVITGVTIGDSPQIAGVTIGFLGKARVSIVYSEVVRDQIDDLLRNGSATVQEYEQRLRLTAAHEVGHQPLYGIGESAQHAENGLMADGGHNGLGAADTPFSAKSIKRFRTINQWRQKAQ